MNLSDFAKRTLMKSLQWPTFNLTRTAFNTTLKSMLPFVPQG